MRVSRIIPYGLTDDYDTADALGEFVMSSNLYWGGFMRVFFGSAVLAMDPKGTALVHTAFSIDSTENYNCKRHCSSHWENSTVVGISPGSKLSQRI